MGQELGAISGDHALGHGLNVTTLMRHLFLSLGSCPCVGHWFNGLV